MNNPRLLLLVGCNVVFVACTACSSSSDEGPNDGGAAGSTQDAPVFLDTTTDQISEPDPEKIVLYAHNDTTLFSIDPADPKLPLTEIGKFDCVGTNTGQTSAMTDLAVDKYGKLYGVSAAAIYLDMKVEGNVVHCLSSKVSIKAGSLGTAARFYGLSITPAIEALGNVETLVGANSNGDLYQINQSDGQVTLVGSFGKVPADDGLGHAYLADAVGKNWELSGDIVFLENNGNPVGFATVRDCPNPPETDGCSLVDTLVEIDVKLLAPTPTGGTPPVVTRAVRGQVLPQGCTKQSCGFGSMYGIAALSDRVFGFSRRGDVLSINNSTGEGTLVGTPLTVPPYADGFAGAGVTTLAPVLLPPPK